MFTAVVWGVTLDVVSGLESYYINPAKIAKTGKRGKN